VTIAPDAVPDDSVVRVQVTLAARGGCRDALADGIGQVAEHAATRLGAAARVTVLTQIDDDPFPAANPVARPFQAVLEVQGAADAGPEPLLAALDGIGECLEPVAHLDLSGVLVGAPQEIIPCALTPVRYQYFMRRRAGTSRVDYLDHYFHHHSQFGFATPGIEGYTQFHVDPAASALAAARLGLGAVVCDSVSELHLASLATFLGALAESGYGGDAIADEETFVDRESSVSITCDSRGVTA